MSIVMLDYSCGIKRWKLAFALLAFLYPPLSGQTPLAPAKDSQAAPELDIRVIPRDQKQVSEKSVLQSNLKGFGREGAGGMIPYLFTVLPGETFKCALKTERSNTLSLSFWIPQVPTKLVPMLKRYNSMPMPMRSKISIKNDTPEEQQLVVYVAGDMNNEFTLNIEYK